MTCAKRTAVVLMVATLGIWGCARGPDARNNPRERIQALEIKNSKLEDDFRAVAAARDQLRQKLIQAEEQQAKMQQEIEQLQAVIKECNELKQQLAARTGERDQLQTQFEAFRKNLRDLLGQTESALNTTTNQPVTANVEVSEKGKS